MNLRYSILIYFLSVLGAQVDYHTQIQPLFNNSCISCHGGSGGLSLTSYDNIMNGGNSGDVVIPYNHASTPMTTYTTIIEQRLYLGLIVYLCSQGREKIDKDAVTKNHLSDI